MKKEIKDKKSTNTSWIGKTATMAIEYPYVFARIEKQKTDKTNFRIVSEIKDCGR